MRPLILIVDDTRLARMTLRFMLEAQGYDVVEAASTAEAVRVYGEERPDVVTMDMLMDGHNGIIAIQALRHSESKRTSTSRSITSGSSPSSKRHSRTHHEPAEDSPPCVHLARSG